MNKEKFPLLVLNTSFTIHRFPAGHAIPEQVYASAFYSVCKTEDELSIVCDASIELNSENKDTGYACMKVLGPLDFSLTGVLADISAVLAEAELSIFALSTYDTDYILVKETQLSTARQALIGSGFGFKN